MLARCLPNKSVTLSILHLTVILQDPLEPRQNGPSHPINSLDILKAPPYAGLVTSATRLRERVLVIVGLLGTIGWLFHSVPLSGAARGILRCGTPLGFRPP